MFSCLSMLTHNQRKLMCKEKRKNQNIDKPRGYRRSKKERAISWCSTACSWFHDLSPAAMSDLELLIHCPKLALPILFLRLREWWQLHPFKCSGQNFGLSLTLFRDPWVAQRFGTRLWPRAWSWGPGIKSHIGFLAWSLLLPLPVSLPLFSLSHE